ncbi:MAG: isochorismatase family protein [Thalassotalea sp.]|nr:isochorismatase family protein [Thalassotalea sp.]
MSRLQLENTGLIIIDIQGKLARLVHDSEHFIKRSEKLVMGAKVLELPIVLVEQNSEKLGSTITELSRHLSTVNPINKFTFDACLTPSFVSALQNEAYQHIDNWLVCGIEAHICVFQTTMGIKQLGYHVEVVSDCISSRNGEHVKLALSRLASNGIEITNLEMCLYELLKDCRHESFKEVLTLIR